MAIVTDRQVKRLQALLKSGKPLLVAAMRVDMDRKTARKYRDQAKLPSELDTWPRTWRTRQDPFADVWEEVREQLELSPGLQAKTLLAWLQRHYPGRFEDGQLQRFNVGCAGGKQLPALPRRCSSRRSTILAGYARPISPI